MVHLFGSMLVDSELGRIAKQELGTFATPDWYKLLRSRPGSAPVFYYFVSWKNAHRPPWVFRSDEKIEEKPAIETVKMDPEFSEAKDTLALQYRLYEEVRMQFKRPKPRNPELEALRSA